MSSKSDVARALDARIRAIIQEELRTNFPRHADTHLPHGGDFLAVERTIVMGDASTSLAVTVNANPIPMTVPYKLLMTKVELRVVTPPVGASIIVDLNVNGATVFTLPASRPVILAGATTGFALIQWKVDLETLHVGDVLTFDIDQVGSGTPGGPLMVYIYGSPVLKRVAP